MPRLLLVVDGGDGPPERLVRHAAAAAAAGVTFVVLRVKGWSEVDACALAERVREALPDRVTIAVNGPSRAAAAIGAGGHLPEDSTIDPDDFPWHGRSIHGKDGAERGRDAGAAYLVLGTIFPTASKPGYRGIGPQGIRPVASLRQVPPIFAIGGIRAETVPDVLHAGAWGVAVRSAVMAAPDPRKAAESLLASVHNAVATLSP